MPEITRPIWGDLNVGTKLRRRVVDGPVIDEWTGGVVGYRDNETVVEWSHTITDTQYANHYLTCTMLPENVTVEDAC